MAEKKYSKATKHIIIGNQQNEQVEIIYKEYAFNDKFQAISIKQ
jgi:hypothetical protein